MGILKGNAFLNRARIQWVDGAKGIGILLVILGHCYLDPKYTFWFYSFHIPLFFFLSGFTFSSKKENFSTFAIRKAKALVVPYLVFAALTMLCDVVLASTHGRTYDVWTSIVKYIVQIRYTALWFLPCLFLAELGFFTVRKAHPIIITIIAFFLFYIYRITIYIDLPWNIDLSILAIGYISLGFAARRYGITDVLDKHWSMLIIAFTWIKTSWINYSIHGRIDWFSDRFGSPFLYLVGSIAGVMTIVLLVKRINIKLISKLGSNSLVFFGLNRTVLDLLYVLYGKAGISTTGDSIVLAIISVGATITILVPVHCFLLRFAPWSIGKRKIL